MTKVTMYQANDGSLHKKPAERDAKNIELRTAPLVEEFVNALSQSTPGISVDDGGAFLILLENLPTFITTHADTLRTLLNRAVQPAGRPRKAKDGAEKPARKPRAAKPATSPTPPATAAASATLPGASDVDALLDSLS